MENNNGWIKLHRKLTEWEWFTDSKTVHLFLYFMLLANHEDGKWRGQEIKRGQFITGRQSLSEKTGISEQSIRTCIERLKSTNEITSKSTSKFTIITILKYDYYQKDDRISTNKLTYGLTNNQPTTNQQSTTNNKNNNNKNDNNIIQDETSSSEIAELIKSFEVINPASSKFYGNKTQRKACMDLIKTYGFDRVKNVIENTLPKTNNLNYLPTITTPLQLYDKWSSLEAGILKLKGKDISKNKVAFN